MNALITSKPFSCAGFAQALQAYNKEREKFIDESLLNEGETPEEFLNRMYRFGAWRVVMMAGLCDWAIYKADDMLRESYPTLVEDREAMMRHYHFYEERLLCITEAPEDYIADIRLKAYERNSRKMNALLNSLRKEYKSKGVPAEDICSMLGLFLNVAELTHKVYEVSIKPLGTRLQAFLPTYIADALRRLERSESAAERILEKIDKERIIFKCESNDTLLQLAHELFLNAISPDELEAAAKFANKELKKAK